MKKILLFITVFSISQLSFSQDIKIGLKAGVNFANQKFDLEGLSYSPTSVTSFHFQGLIDVPLNSIFSVQPGIGVSGKGFKINDNDTFYGGKADLMYLDIPINAVAKFPVPALGKLFVGAGPYVGIGLSGKAKTDGESEDIEFGTDGDFKRGDFGANFMGGLELNQGFLINVNYGLGLSNITQAEEEIDLKTTNRVFSVSVGYMF